MAAGLAGCFLYREPILACILLFLMIYTALTILQSTLTLGLLSAYVLHQIDQDLEKAEKKKADHEKQRALKALHEEEKKRQEAVKALAAPQEGIAPPPESTT
ncbi:MAG: hypothetical protein AMXMBFR33_01960 [Candidatus Xenobia bacterium]